MEAFNPDDSENNVVPFQGDNEALAEEVENAETVPGEADDDEPQDVVEQMAA